MGLDFGVFVVCLVLVAAVSYFCSIYKISSELWDTKWQQRKKDEEKRLTDEENISTEQHAAKQDVAEQPVFGMRMKLLFLSGSDGPLDTPIMFFYPRWKLKSMGLFLRTTRESLTRMAFYPIEGGHYSLPVPQSKVDGLCWPAAVVLMVQMALMTFVLWAPQLGKAYVHYDKVDVVHECQKNTSKVLNNWRENRSNVSSRGSGSDLAFPIVEVVNENAACVQHWLKGMSHLYIHVFVANVALHLVTALAWWTTGLFGVMGVLFQAFVMFVDTDAILRKLVLLRDAPASSSLLLSGFFLEKLFTLFALFRFQKERATSFMLMRLLSQRLLPASGNLLVVSAANPQGSLLVNSHLTDCGFWSKTQTTLTSVVAIVRRSGTVEWSDLVSLGLQYLVALQAVADGQSIRLLRMTAIAEAFKDAGSEFTIIKEPITPPCTTGDDSHTPPIRSSCGDWCLHIMKCKVRREKRIGFRLELSDRLGASSDRFWYVWKLKVEGKRTRRGWVYGDQDTSNFTQELVCESVGGPQTRTMVSSSAQEAMVCIQDLNADGVHDGFQIGGAIRHARGPGWVNPVSDPKIESFRNTEMWEVHKVTVKLLACARRPRKPDCCENKRSYEAEVRGEGYKNEITDFDTPLQLYEKFFENKQDVSNAETASESSYRSDVSNAETASESSYQSLPQCCAIAWSGA